MLRITIIVAIFIQFCLAQEGLRFSQGKHRQEYQVKKLDIQIEVIEDLSFTKITAEIYNHTDFNQEGEMIIPLPEGTTVSGYSLDINGKMREASVVDKGKALKAYEEIKAKNIDPGIVEKKANNEYRIRVFPILPQKTKRTSFSFVTRSKTNKGHYNYSLPLDFNLKVDEVSVSIIAAGSEIRSNHFKINEIGNPTIIKNTNLNETINILTPVATISSAIIQKKSSKTDAATFYKVIIPDNIPLVKNSKPDEITIVWDSSATNDDVLIAQQFSLLDQYFKHNKNTNIKLYSIGHELGEIGRFNVKNGNWSDLNKALKKLTYDGALDFSATRLINEDDLKNPTLVFVDKPRYNLLKWKIKPQRLDNIDLRCSTSAQILGELNMHRLVPMIDSELILGYFDTTEDPKTLRFVLKGDMPFQGIPIAYQNESSSLFHAKFTKANHQLENENQSVTISLAQASLDQLTNEQQPPSVICQFALENKLVSDYTSMIVLETLNDYAKYEISPPESMLTNDRNRSIYQNLVNEKRLEQSHVNDDKRRFHSRWHPWYRYDFKIVANSIDIWDENLKFFFQKEHYDEKSYLQVLQWNKDVESTDLILKKSKTQKEIENALSDLHQLDQSRKKFFDIPNEYPKDKNINISFRGVVKEPKIHMIKPNTDLRDFARFDYAPVIQIYRNSQCVTFNLDSKNYKNTPLQAGDMLVVPTLGDSLREQGSDTKKEYIDKPYILDSGTNLNQFYFYNSLTAHGGYDPFSSDGDDFSEPTPTKPAPEPEKKSFILGKIASPQPTKQIVNVSANEWKTFENQLKIKPNLAYQNYLALKSNKARDTHFYIEAARLLYKLGHPSDARKVLSNIIAGDESSTTAQKRFLMWLMFLGDHEHALSFISGIDPSLKNPDFQYIKLLILHGLNKITPEDAKMLSEGLKCSFQMDCFKPENENPYDLKILGMAESSGIMNFINVEYKAPKDSKLNIGNLYEHGLYSDISEGIEEYTMKQAIPGIYKIKVSNAAIATFRIEIYCKSKQSNDRKKVITIHTDGNGGWKDVASIDLQLP